MTVCVGGTVDAPIFAETVSAFTILGADGNETIINKQSKDRDGHSLLPFARVSLGALGIVTRMTLDVLPRSATNVVPVKTALPWEDFAVIPESYATAWTCLQRNLEIKKGQTLVIRGATSALGRAAVNIAADAGAHIIATTRKKQRFEALYELGAHRAEIETPKLSESIAERKQIDAVLDLVGNTTFMNSLSMLRKGERMCLAGWVGGLDPVDNFNPLLQMPSGVYFTFFGSFVFGTSDFPVSDIPLQSIVDKVAAGVYKAKPARVFQFDDIREAHEAMESNQANGKMVVRV